MKKTSTKHISFIGSGNVATHLALAFHAAGHVVDQVLSREYDHAQLLASRVGAVAIDRTELLRQGSDFFFLAVNDDAIFDLALDLRLPEAVVIHTSGSTPLSVLQSVSRRHGVVWSPQTFVRDIAMDYLHLPFCIEGSSPEVTDEIEALVDTVSQQVHRLDFEQRRWTHLAAVMVNNFGNAMNAMAQELMQCRGLDFAMLRPLIDMTARKADFGDLWAQQTGPAKRHDYKTISAQRRLLADEPQLLQLYDLLTEIIQSK